ncbi:hypothetical protein [Bradyrhizobium sp. Gha]|uniref:hypothetical protein n=1 Tax=Bradyrhizobium sp. Gha TaxID=1855318 RepID=UPI0008DF6867|nr:hypothetical protein [Bradyrhizobium sp. Gha]SFI32788.1 hypothetical protein SAMN05216525_107130 [Bradyrhizobium sp. Gha]
MNLGKENDIIQIMTGPAETKGLEERDIPPALLEYLRKDTAGRLLLDTLADLLDPAGDSVWRLKLVRRDRRHVDLAQTVKDKVDAFERVRELTGSIASRTLVSDIVERLQKPGSSWKAERRPRQWLLQENGVTVAKIAADKPMTEAMAKHVAAAEYGFTYDTFRDVFRDIERSVRGE